MDIDIQLESLGNHKASQWLVVVQSKWPEIPAWVTEHHPERLPCSLEQRILHGSYNVGLTAVFTNGEKWFIRFPLVGHTSDEYLDLKIINEVKTLKLISEKTDIPVPEVKAWGSADHNRLGLGPFIMEQFIEGERLKPILSGSSDPGDHILSDKLDDRTFEIIYRQLARFMLQLFALDFDQIGNLPGASSPLQPPLTMTANEINLYSGAKVMSPRTEQLSTAGEYFNHVVKQHWQQFTTQRNSVYEEERGKRNYAFHKALGSLVERHTWPEFDRGPFKLICDDFGPANMIVDNRDDLNIVGVVDLEWSYIGPAQLLATAPWWILQARPNTLAASDEHAGMYLQYLNKFMQILEAEEEKLQPDQRKGLSSLVKRSQENGTMWYLMVLRGFYIDVTDLPCDQLIASTPDWENLAAEVAGEEAQAFVTKKLDGLRPFFDEKKMVESMEEKLKAGTLDLATVIERLERLLK